MTKTTLLSLCLCAFPLAACGSSSGEETSTTSPTGPIATDAAEAWPNAPGNVPTIGGADILAACSMAGACSPEVMNLDLGERTALIDLCVYDAVFSAERAIPMSGFQNSNERTEYWTQCVLDAASCDAVSACKTERDSSIYCEEDGCHATKSLHVSCNGNVATLDGDSNPTTRDCSRSFSQCDPESPTGCTDRHFTQCGADAVSGPDRCDGNVRLGCDGGSQVSYRDCTRLGGSCGANASGEEACIYTGGSDPDCTPELKSASCNGDMLSACVNGRRLSMKSALCAP